MVRLTNRRQGSCFELTQCPSQRWVHLQILDLGFQGSYWRYFCLVLLSSRSHLVQWYCFISRCSLFILREVRVGVSQDDPLYTTRWFPAVLPYLRDDDLSSLCPWDRPMILMFYGATFCYNPQGRLYFLMPHEANLSYVSRGMSLLCFAGQILARSLSRLDVSLLSRCYRYLLG